jgi:hypothetical protein
LLVLGDVHCDRRHLRELVERAAEERCDALLSLGDLCYLPRDPKDAASSAPPAPCSAAPGLSFCSSTTTPRRSPKRAPRPPRPPVLLGFRLHHLPAGTRFRLGRLRCLAYGGSLLPRLDPDSRAPSGATLANPWGLASGRRNAVCAR